MIFNTTAFIVYGIMLILSIISLVANIDGFVKKEKNYFRTYLVATVIFALITASYADKVF